MTEPIADDLDTVPHFVLDAPPLWREDGRMSNPIAEMYLRRAAAREAAAGFGAATQRDSVPLPHGPVPTPPPQTKPKLDSYAQAIFGRSSPVRSPSHAPYPKPYPQPVAGWSAIAAPPAAVEAMVAGGVTPGWQGQSAPPPSSAGQTVYGPYQYDGFYYAIVSTGGGYFDAPSQWYQAPASVMPLPWR